MAYVFLVGAICSEVAETLSLRAASDGRSAMWILVAAGYAVAFACLSLGLQRGLALGVAYGIWAATGVALVAALSIPVFGETLTATQGVGIALVAGGVLALEMGGAH